MRAPRGVSSRSSSGVPKGTNPRRRASGRSVATTSSSSGGGATGIAKSLLGMYNDDSPGLKVGPTAVLIMSLFIGSLNSLLSGLLEPTTQITEKINAVHAIDQLVDPEFEENIAHFCTLLQKALAVNDHGVLIAASRALGHLARIGGNSSADGVETQLDVAIHLLPSPQAERKLCAVLVLKELAINVPVLFSSHLPAFMKDITSALHHPSIVIRVESHEALNACLDICSKRDNIQNKAWYQILFSAAEQVIGTQTGSPEALHGALLTYVSLLSYAGQWMTHECETARAEKKTRFEQVHQTFARLSKEKNSKDRDRLVRRAVIASIPHLAKEPYTKEFVTLSLEAWVHFLLAATKPGQHDKSLAFESLSSLLEIVGSHFLSEVPEIFQVISTALQPKKPCLAALTCLATLTKQLKIGSETGRIQPDDYENQIAQIIKMAVQLGLSTTLVHSLRELKKCTSSVYAKSSFMPSLEKVIDSSLFTVISTVLRNTVTHTGLVPGSRVPNLDPDPQLILALHTLGSFEFESLDVRNLRDWVHFLDADSPAIRKEAAITCAHLMLQAGDPLPVRGQPGEVISEVLQKLLMVGIADPDPEIRKTVFEKFEPRFDQHLAQAENLRSLFTALNDECFDIREIAIVLIGRLTSRNPAYVMPSLRKTLIQLLTELEYSGDNKSKEESAVLLGRLIVSSEKLIKPCVESILKALLPKLGPDSSTRVEQSVLATLGDLSVVGAESMAPHVRELVPLIITILKDQSATTKRVAKREVALHTLGQLVRSTGYVIEPFLDYKDLLEIIMKGISSERSPTIRSELLKGLGILGAVDPYRHKMVVQADLALVSSKPGSASSDIPLPTVSSSSNEYNPTVVITALMKIMRDPNLSVNREVVLTDLMLSLHNLGIGCRKFLPVVVPELMHVMHKCEAGFREQIFKALAELVGIVKQHIRDYSDSLFNLMLEFWDSSLLSPILALAEQISCALNEEFKASLPRLIPLVLQELQPSKLKPINATKILKALETFGANIEDYLHLIIPALVGLLEQNEGQVVKAAIETLRMLCTKLNFSDYVSKIIHPLNRLLEKNPPPPIREEIMKTLCTLIRKLGSDYSIFIPMIRKYLVKHRIVYPEYEGLVGSLLSGQPLVEKEIIDVTPKESDKDPTKDDNSQKVKKKATSVRVIQQAWESSAQRVSKDDWLEWMRKFSGALIAESPDPSLYACLALALDYPPLVKELFNAVFLSVWNELHESLQVQLVANLESVLNIESMPHEILQTLLNLAEYMEHEEKALPIERLGSIAQRCHAYAKALHYKEMEFQQKPNSPGIIEELISINHQLQQPEAAEGIVAYAKQRQTVELQESLYEKLGKWEQALSVYEAKYKEGPLNFTTVLGQMRCLHAIGEWEQLAELTQAHWNDAALDIKKEIAPLAATSSLNLSSWNKMREYVEIMGTDSVSGSFYSAILAIHNNCFDDAQDHISRTRAILDTKLTALLGESYDRAYSTVVMVQQLSELEEVIEYKKTESEPRRSMIRATWEKRLKGCKYDVDTWQQLLSIHTLVVSPQENMDIWLKFVGLCRKSGQQRLAIKILNRLIGYDLQPECSKLPMHYPRVAFAFIKTLWASSAVSTQNSIKAFELLQSFSQSIENSNDLHTKGHAYLKLGEWQLYLSQIQEDFTEVHGRTRLSPSDVHVKNRFPLTDDTVGEILSSLKNAIECNSNWYKAWHAWALTNFEVISHYERQNVPTDRIVSFIVTAIQGFFKSIALGPTQTLQDALRLLSLLFKHGQNKEVESALIEGFSTVNIDTWIQVIPQIIARIHSNIPSIRHLTHELLTGVGKQHPQAVVFPLTVASKSQSAARLEAANNIISKMRKQSAILIDQALVVSQELIRVAILWHEMWHDGLEEASRAFYIEHNLGGMLAALAPLHQILERGPETQRERSFKSQYGHDLQEALEWCKKYQRTNSAADIHQAWDLYYHVFRRIVKQLPQMTTLELQYVSDKLDQAKGLKLAVPGTYRPGEPIIEIKQVAPILSVITSKQRPRKLTMIGSNDIEYKFLLKGHEDLRQDERVMQLFSLVNNLLCSNSDTSKSHLSIRTFSVVPLSHNSGLIGWVQHSDTLHQLIREYRETHEVWLDIEHRLMQQMAPTYDSLTLIQKVEVFEYPLSIQEGLDLERILWLKSANSEVWLERRTNYTRSMAVMSMVGYILGLGDRHPSNLMLERNTCQVIHIDFGDCFEVAMHRDKFPERIPFRLTRMLINAMEVSGIEGNFRFTCEKVMSVLRRNKESLMAVLEAFVYDPLINWRLLTSKSPNKINRQAPEEWAPPTLADGSQNDTPGHRIYVSHGDDDVAIKEADHRSEVLNERAISVLKRVNRKLTGRDFSNDVLNVHDQVDKLIKQATSHENLCRCYVGWCPFW
ncbi:protein kinase, atypical group [Pelomyxa schiedti]|nr:protein kinase, atypical group [Pelomyxa schiedti]